MRNAIIIFMLNTGVGTCNILARSLTLLAGRLATLRWRRQMLAELCRRRRG